MPSQKPSNNSAEKRVVSVLLVEDHALVGQALRRTLEDADDIRVVGKSADADSAIRAARRLKPDVVVMDFALPGKSGAEATEEILKTVKTAVLILSMHSEPSYVRAALDSGASGYLLKSAADLDLAEAIRQVAAGRPVLDRGLTRRSVLGEMTRALSPRELEILRMIVQGKSHGEIAAELGIRVNTVRAHRANMMQAMGVHKAVQLALYAVARGLIQS
jgi:two-component system, NarL family, response regulator NreC